MSRWWTYQRERFPILAHGPLVAAIAGAVVAVTARACGAAAAPTYAITVAAVISFLFFLELRIADEHKDFEDDLKFRPYRAVPRGLVSLAELRRLGVAAAILQAVLCSLWDPVLLLPLVLIWGYMGLMTKEFFVPSWLRAHPVVYAASHMVVLSLFYLFMGTCAWHKLGASMPTALWWLAGMGYANGLVIEIGRKIRAPMDEEAGVETYSSLWGSRRALSVWAGFVVATGLLAVLAVAAMSDGAPRDVFTSASSEKGSQAAVGAGHAVRIIALVVTAGLVLVAYFAAGFAKNPKPQAGAKIELAAGLWTLLLHLGLIASVAIG